MQLSILLWGISLWLGFNAVILLTVTELVLPYCGKMNILIEKGRLRHVALAIGILFIMTIAIQAYQAMR